MFICQELSIKVIMDCRTTAAHKVRTRLEFKQYDVILTKEQSVLTKMKISFEGEKHNILCQITGLIYNFMTINSQQKLMEMVIVAEIL